MACRVCRDVAKALSTGDVENPSAYALGVLRNAAADAPAYRLTAAHVDSLIDQSVAAAMRGQIDALDASAKKLLGATGVTYGADYVISARLPSASGE